MMVKEKPLSRLRAVSLFPWSVEQNAQDTQMTTRVTEGARRESPRFSRLAASPLNARTRVHSLTTARSLINKTTASHLHHTFIVHFFGVTARLRRKNVYFHVLWRK